MILRTVHIGAQIFFNPSLPGVRHVELQMLSVVVVAAEHSGGMSAERLVYHGIDAMAGDDCALRLPLDLFRRDDFLGDEDDAPCGLRLFLVFPARTVDTALPSRSAI